MDITQHNDNQCICNTPRIIALTGAKHCGKTSVGKKIANILHCLFIDIDAVIEKNNGKTVREIFKEGKDIFQKAELLALCEVISNAQNDAMVISCGGGIIDNQPAIALIKQRPRITNIFLEISAETAWRRITMDKTAGLPPFLNTENPIETHRRLHEQRQSAYKQIATIIIPADGKTQVEIAAEIVGRLEGQG